MSADRRLIVLKTNKATAGGYVMSRMLSKTLPFAAFIFLGVLTQDNRLVSAVNFGVAAWMFIIFLCEWRDSTFHEPSQHQLPDYADTKPAYQENSIKST